MNIEYAKNNHHLYLYCTLEKYYKTLKNIYFFFHFIIDCNKFKNEKEKKLLFHIYNYYLKNKFLRIFKILYLIKIFKNYNLK